MITKQQLELISRETLKYPLQLAEKDYFLTLALKIIVESNVGKNLIFKGGTALHHCYLDQFRFSEDLDFSTNKNNLAHEDIKKIFSDNNLFTIKKLFLSPATIKIEKLQFAGPLIQPNSLKIEIDRTQNVLLKPQVVNYNNVWGIKFRVAVMDIMEICAEKIRATSDRARYRDFYDLILIVNKYRLNLKDVCNLIKQKELRKTISKEKIMKNWKMAGTLKGPELNQIYYSHEIADFEIESMINNLPFTKIQK